MVEAGRGLSDQWTEDQRLALTGLLGVMTKYKLLSTDHECRPKHL